MKLTHDIPENKGIENGIKRAKQMTSFRWTPVKSLPAVESTFTMENEKNYRSMLLSPWLPQKGLIYSSVLKNQKFIGFNVSFESFVTALSDPKSVLYKYNVDGQGRRNANCWYGVVCSCFASYVLGMDERWICKNWPTVKGVSCLGQPKLNELKLLDIVLNVKRHIAVITDIIRDENGNVRLVEVSESTLPFCRATLFTPEEFRGYWYENEFNIYRKSGLDQISYIPSPFVTVKGDPERAIEGDPCCKEYQINRDIMPDQGNRSNYKQEQEIVLDLLNDTWDQVEIVSEEGVKNVFDVSDGCVVIPENSTAHLPGYYTASAVSSDGKRKSSPVQYAVTGFELNVKDPALFSVNETSPAKIREGSEVTVNFHNTCNDRIKMIYIHSTENSGERKRFPITEEDIQKGNVTITFPEVSDTYFVFASADNQYGEYASNYLYFSTKP